MTWWLGFGLTVFVLGVAWVALLVHGATRWADLMRMHTGQIEAARVDGKERLSSPARIDAPELDGLPEPVRRYFRAVLEDGQPIIAAATIELAGTINMSATGGQWKPFTSQQRVITRRPGFLWDAQVVMFPGLPARVEDSCIAGEGRLIAKLLGLFTVADAHGRGEMARGEFMRWFAEAAWYPTALSDYQPQHGMLLPMAGEAAWLRPEGRKTYFKGAVTRLRYEVAR